SCRGPGWPAASTTRALETRLSAATKTATYRAVTSLRRLHDARGSRPVGLRPVAELPPRIRPPAVDRARVRHPAGVGASCAECDDRQAAVYRRRRRVRSSDRAVAELPVGVRTPTPGRPGRRQAAGVVAAGRERHQGDGDVRADGIAMSIER